MPQPWYEPTDTDVQSEPVPTRVMPALGAKLPIPSWPSALRPQHQSVPGARNPQAFSLPTETAVQSVEALSLTGRFDPAGASGVMPQHQSVPSV
jgi:hypothetical protein